MERLLCIKIASRGDLLLAGPAFQELRQIRPRAHLTLVVGRSCEDVARHLPFFDEVFLVNDQALLAGSFLEKMLESWQILRTLKERGCSRNSSSTNSRGSYSEVFIFHRDWRYGLLTWLARIPIRRGLQRMNAPCFLTHPYYAGQKEHHTSQYLHLVMTEKSLVRDRSSLGTDSKQGTEIAASLPGIWSFAPGEREAALAVAAQHGFRPDDGTWIALGFGGGQNVKTQTELKKWPLTSYFELARRLANSGHKLIWVGDGEDAALLGDAKIGVNLAGKLRVAETAAVISACAHVVTNDSLILHLAEAVGAPTVAIFGPTDPAHYCPLGAKSTYLWIGDSLPCSPCHRDGYFPPCAFEHRCMTGLSVDLVQQKIVKNPSSFR